MAHAVLNDCDGRPFTCGKSTPYFCPGRGEIRRPVNNPDALMTVSMLATRDIAQETATYRAFYLDAKRKVRAARILRAANDCDAHTIARTLPNGFGIELWERGRFLATFPPRAGLMQDAG